MRYRMPGTACTPPEDWGNMGEAGVLGVTRCIRTRFQLCYGSFSVVLLQLLLFSRVSADRLYCTVGCHPTRCGEFDAHPGGPEAYLQVRRKQLERVACRTT